MPATSRLERLATPFVTLGRASAAGLAGLGYAAALLAESLWYVALGWRLGQPVRWRAVLEQMRQIGVDAVPIVAMLSFTVGLMLAIQLIATLSEFGAESQVVLAVAISVTREFGPLITGIVVAGRSGSALAARLGAMTVSQEIDALRVIGIEPVRYLVAPALVAMLLMLPVLTIIADFMAILGAALYSAGSLQLSVPAYLLATVQVLEPFDIIQGLMKAGVFAVLITLIGVASGFSVSGGAEGVGRATTRSVVLCISALVVADMLFSFFLTR